MNIFGFEIDLGKLFSKSTLSILTIISFLGTLIGNGTAVVVFIICFPIWLIFVGLSLVRNFKEILGI